MFNYMVDLSLMKIDPDLSISIHVSGHDIQSLIFAYLDELLFRFSTEGFCCVQVSITNLDLTNYVLEAKMCVNYILCLIHFIVFIVMGKLTMRLVTLLGQKSKPSLTPTCK